MRLDVVRSSSRGQKETIHSEFHILAVKNDTDRVSSMDRATEMDITMIGLQNAGKTSLLRVLAVSIPSDLSKSIIAQCLTSFR